jgi:hypothetical protein
MRAVLKHPAIWVVLLLAACEEPGTAVNQPAMSAALTSDSGGGPPDSGPIFRIHGTGDYASFSFQLWDSTASFAYGYVSVYQDRSGATRQTWLTFFVSRCDAMFNCRNDAGYGPIPDGDFQGSAHGGLRLATNTSLEFNPDMVLWSGSGGPLDLSWRPNGLVSVRSQSTMTQQYGPLRWHSTGGWTNASAWVAGTALDMPVVNVEGSVGSYQNASIQIQMGSGDSR